MYAAAKPKSAPVSTSVGKCTNRYTREKAIRKAASIAANAPVCLRNHKTPAAAKDEMECPDGNE